MKPIDLWERLRVDGAAVIYRPVDASQLREAELALRFRFPPSYRELVLQAGAPAISTRIPDADPNNAWNLPFAVLTPHEIVRLTSDWRTSDVVNDPDHFEDPASSLRIQERLSQAIFFQLQHDPNDAYVFLVTRDPMDGEYHVADFAHDYLEELQWNSLPSLEGPVWPSFEALTHHVTRTIRDQLPAFR